MEEIKRCPFCGGKGYLMIDRGKKNKLFYIHVKCNNCNAQGKTYFTQDNPDTGNPEEVAMAISAWNMRTE